MFSSYMLAKVIKIKYQTIKIIPKRLSNFQPFIWVATTKNTTVESKDNVEYVRPELKMIIKLIFE